MFFQEKIQRETRFPQELAQFSFGPQTQAMSFQSQGFPRQLLCLRPEALS